MTDEIFRTYVGWIGLEQYDETNPVAQAFLDRFEVHGRRPEYVMPITRTTWRDIRGGARCRPTAVARGK